MGWIVKNTFFGLLAILIVHLTVSEASPLSEDLLEVNITPEQYQDSENQRKFKEKCLKASGGNEAFQDMQDVRDYLSDCVSHIFYNASALQMELNAAYNDGNLTDVIRNYCDKRGDFARCFSPFMKTLEKCMENEDEKKFVRVGMKFLRAVSEYVCARNGERTRKLVEDGALECMDEHMSGILECFRETKSLKTMFQSIYEDAFLFNEAKCTDIPNYEACAIKELKNCSNTSAIEFHDGLFRVIKRTVPCDCNKAQDKL